MDVGQAPARIPTIAGLAGGGDLVIDAALITQLIVGIAAMEFRLAEANRLVELQNERLATQYQLFRELMAPGLNIELQMRQHYELLQETNRAIQRNTEACHEDSILTRRALALTISAAGLGEREAP